MRKGVVAAMGLLVLLGIPLGAFAQEDTEDLNTTVQLLKKRLREQDRRIADLEAQQATSQPTSKEARAEEIKKILKEINAETGKQQPAAPKWLDNLKFAGDFRLRYEYNGFNWGKTADSEKKDRNRARFRLRFGFTKTWMEDQLEVGFRLASGENNDATSTNQSFTQDFSKKPVWIDLAYARFSPKDLKGFSVIGGKMVIPWVENEIFMDRDVNPEGFWAEYKSAKLGPLEPFVGGGYFLVNESADGEDATMYIAQAGTKVNITKDLKYTLAGNYQEWTDYAFSGGAPKGNDSPLTRVPEFRIINLSNNVDLPVFGRPLNLFADFAHNCGAADQFPDYEGQDNAFATGAKYGQNKVKGDWSLKYRYAWVEANSLPGQFVDSDFGFANRKGHVIGGEYNILDNLTIGVNVFLTQPIFSPTTTSGSSASEDLTTTVMADLVWKF